MPSVEGLPTSDADTETFPRIVANSTADVGLTPSLPTCIMFHSALRAHVCQDAKCKSTGGVLTERVTHPTGEAAMMMAKREVAVMASSARSRWKEDSRLTTPMQRSERRN